jgi:release factor glutamine methyltransferase
MLLTLIETYRYLINEINCLYDPPESRAISLLLIEACGYSRLSLSLQPQVEISNETLAFINNSLVQLKKGKPVQYIIGSTEFYGMTFLVNEYVLIPRSETEQMVDMIIKGNRMENPVVLDIGTGSGCISIALSKHFPNSVVYASDVSEQAIRMAKNNSILNNTNVKFVWDDILSPSFKWEPDFFDIIVSNPPYVLEGEKKDMKPNVIDFEPSLALYANAEDSLLFYKRIFEFSLKHLKLNGCVYCEINENLGREIYQLAESMNFKDVEIIKDLHEKNRFIKAENFQG